MKFLQLTKEALSRFPGTSLMALVFFVVGLFLVSDTANFVRNDRPGSAAEYGVAAILFFVAAGICLLAVSKGVKAYRSLKE